MTVAKRKGTGLLQRLQARGMKPLPPLDFSVLHRMVADATFKDTAPVKRIRKGSIPDYVDPNHPIMLEAAARIAFPDGSMTVSGLRNEIRKGNLQASKLAGRIYVTISDIQQMRVRCKIGAGVEARAHNSISANQSGPVGRGFGSSSTRHQPASASNAAQEHLRVIAQRLKKPLPNTLPKNTSQISAAVIPIKS